MYLFPSQYSGVNNFSWRSRFRHKFRRYEHLQRNAFKNFLFHSIAKVDLLLRKETSAFNKVHRTNRNIKIVSFLFIGAIPRKRRPTFLIHNSYTYFFYKIDKPGWLEFISRNLGEKISFLR